MVGIYYLNLRNDFVTSPLSVTLLIVMFNTVAIAEPGFIIKGYQLQCND